MARPEPRRTRKGVPTATRREIAGARSNLPGPRRGPGTAFPATGIDTGHETDPRSPVRSLGPGTAFPATGIDTGHETEPRSPVRSLGPSRDAQSPCLLALRARADA